MIARIRATEPAQWAELVRALIAALVAVGWLTIDAATVNVVASVVGAAASFVLTRFVRKAVIPTAKLENPSH